MRVAFDISPLATDHKVRGIGAYTQRLFEQFKSGKWKAEFEFFDNPASPPSADIVHYPYFDLFFRTLPAKSKNKRVVTIHDVIPLVFPQYFPAGIRGYINLFFQKRALRNVDALICDSRSSKEDIAIKLASPRQKIHVIYLAPGPNFTKINSVNNLKRIEKKFDLPKKFILYVGDVNWNKNLNNLLEAVKLSKVSLVMIGKALIDKELPETLEIDKKIRKLGIRERIIKTGFVDESDLVAIYNLASATILPSFYEGFGLPVLESMACGTPVVCSKVASLAEITGDLTIYCDPSDPQDIAGKINQALNISKNQRDLISQKSITHASKFTWQKVARQTIAVYQKIYRV